MRREHTMVLCARGAMSLTCHGRSKRGLGDTRGDLDDIKDPVRTPKVPPSLNDKQLNQGQSFNVAESAQESPVDQYGAQGEDRNERRDARAARPGHLPSVKLPTVPR